MNRYPLLATTFAFAACTAAAASAQHPVMPPGMTHEDHLARMADEDALKKRGAAAMGFDQATTTHHFRLTAGGGAIEVTVNDPSDEVGIAQIRAHLREIASDFARGNFDKPFATHAETPPGVPTLHARAARISYAYGDRAGGGRVVIETRDRKARTAVHEFLRYQIREHATGDSTAVR
jgi:hypothetical protein